MSDAPDDFTPEQHKVANKFIAQAKALIEWVDAMPDMEGFAGPVLIGAIVARQEITGSGIHEDEIQKLGKWLERRHKDMIVLSGVARGHLGLKWDDERNEPSFCLTARGREAVNTHDPESN